MGAKKHKKVYITDMDSFTRVGDMAPLSPLDPLLHRLPQFKFYFSNQSFALGGKLGCAGHKECFKMTQGVVTQERNFTWSQWDKMVYFRKLMSIVKSNRPKCYTELCY